MCFHFHLVLEIWVLLLDLFSGSFSVQVCCLIFIAGALHAVFLLGMATFILLWKNIGCNLKISVFVKICIVSYYVIYFGTKLLLEKMYIF